MSRRVGFTLVEVLVTVAIIAVLAAILFPVFTRAREKGRQASCMANQHQFALAATLYAQDHSEFLPSMYSYWDDIKRYTVPKQYTCPTVGEALKNAYVYNHELDSKPLAMFGKPDATMVTADGLTNTSAMPGAYANVAYVPQDLTRRHDNHFIVSFLDGHVENTLKTPRLFTPPSFDNAILWLNAAEGVECNNSAGQLTCWRDLSKYHHDAYPLNTGHPPILRDSVSTLGGMPAVSFRPPVNNPSILMTPDMSTAWQGQQGTMIIVFQPEGKNDNYEYTVFDQSNGDSEQATRRRDRTTNAPRAPGGGGGGGTGGGGGNPPTVSLTATPMSITAGAVVTLQWNSDANTVVSSNFGASGTSGNTTVSPQVTTTYTITVAKNSKEKSASVTVEVVPEENTTTDSFTGNISLFRHSSAIAYPPSDVSYDEPTIWTLESGRDGYQAYRKGVSWGLYTGGTDWSTPQQICIGGSPNGSTGNRRSFDGVVAEVLMYDKVLSAEERQAIEAYFMLKYRIK